MNQNVTLSFGLSLLTLLFFTVVLHPVEAPRVPSEARRPSAESGPAAAEPAAAISKIDEPPKPPDPTARKAEPNEAISKPLPATPSKTEKKTGKQEAPNSPPTQTQRSPMTAVLEGETLEVFAKRVYGPDGDPLDVWKSNRDLLKGPEDPVAPGTILRTP